MSSSTKRSYRRRSIEERIEELEQKIADIKDRETTKARRDSPIQKRLPRLQNTLRKFAQECVDHGRNDVANSTLAFIAGLDRMLNESQVKLVSWNHTSEEEEAPE